MAGQNEVIIRWCPARKWMADNEFADGLAKEVAEGWPRDTPDVPDQIRW